MNFKLAAEISGAIVAGLVVIPLALMAIRTKLDGPALAWIPDDVAQAEHLAGKEGWLRRSLGAFDIAFNVIILRGQQDETISTHCWRASLEGKTWGRAMITWLDWWQENHGPRAASGDLQRATVRVLMLRKALGLD